MKTMKQIIESGEHLDSIHLVLANGQEIDGLLIQERVSHSSDTDGYNIYDMRADDDLSEPYATIEERVIVNWSDSIATKDAVNFSKRRGYIAIKDYGIE